MSKPFVEAINIKKYYTLNKSFLDYFFGANVIIKALNGIYLSIYENETLGLVGESGCGKSTLGRIILNIEKPTQGFIRIGGKRIDSIVKQRSGIKRFCRENQIVFQNPSSTLDPRMTVKDILAEPLNIHFKFTKKELERKIGKSLEIIGLSPLDAAKYSGEFSDGQKQRIALIRSLSLNPKFIVADEPVSALDVSVQAQILNLIKDLKKKMNLTMLFVSHDLHVVRFISDRIAVIYLGIIVEIAPSDELFNNPYHPYTKGLLASILDLNPEANFRQVKIKVDVPVSQIDTPRGCVFSPKCPEISERCGNSQPELKEVSNDHLVACHLV